MEKEHSSQMERELRQRETNATEQAAPGDCCGEGNKGNRGGLIASHCVGMRLKGAMAM